MAFGGIQFYWKEEVLQLELRKGIISPNPE